jgi:hypothetical protein
VLLNSTIAIFCVYKSRKSNIAADLARKWGYVPEMLQLAHMPEDQPASLRKLLEAVLILETNTMHDSLLDKHLPLLAERHKDDDDVQFIGYAAQRLAITTTNLV